MTAYSGVRILDFTRGVAGPMAAMLLGDFDADVVKIASPDGEPEALRPAGLVLNRNKQVLTLDLDRVADRGRARELAARADVALFDHAPGELEALGLDAESLRAGNPGLVHAWMPPYGAKGLLSQLPPRHSLLTALSGVAFRQGAYEDVPVHLVLPLCWYGQGVIGAAAIGAALLERARSGQGQAVTVSGLHGVAEVSGPVKVLAAPPLPRGQPLGASPSYRLYEGSDGRWFFLGTLFANFYAKAIEAIGLGAYWEDFVLNPLAAREALALYFRERPRDFWVDLLREAGVPCAPVGPREAWFAGEAVRNGGLRLSFQDPELGEVAIPAPPARLSATPARVRGLARPATQVDWPRRPAPPAANPAAKAAPLAGVRILDLGTVIAGAYAGGVLASLGAEVIKVEPPEGDPFRSDAGGFMAYNRGKRGLGLDLKQAGARELFLDLVRQVDVVLDNYRLGVRARLGIDYPALKVVNPRIISCSINAYGTEGAWAERPGFDPLLQAEGGMMAAQGGVEEGGDREPILHTIPVNDVATAAVVTMSVVAALNARERTGEGQEILTSLMAQSLTFQQAEVVAYAGRPTPDQGGRDCEGVRALTRFYPCADGWLAIACETEAEAANLGLALGLDLGDPAEALGAARDGRLAREIAAVLAHRSRDAAVADLIAAGVPAAPCLRAAEALQDDFLWQNGMFERWRHPRLGELVSVRGFADFARTPAGFVHPTPDIGQHSAALLAEFGIDPDRIARLFANGAVFEPAMVAGERAKSARPGDGGSALATA